MVIPYDILTDMMYSLHLLIFFDGEVDLCFPEQDARVLTYCWHSLVVLMINPVEKEVYHIHVCDNKV